MESLSPWRELAPDGRAILKSRIFWILVFVLVLSASLRMGYASRAFSLGTCFVPDSQSYLVPAGNLRTGEGYLDREMKPEITRPPGYPGFLAAILGLVGGNLRVALLIQTIILSLIPLLGFFVASMLFDVRVGLTSSVFLALSPWSIAWAARFSSDGLAMFFLGMMLLWLVAVAKSGNNAMRMTVAAALLGISTAAYVLTRPLWPIILFILISVSWIQRRSSLAQRTVTLLVVSVFSLTPVGLWVARNAKVAGVATVSDIGVKTVYWYWAQRVQALKTGEGRFALKEKAMQESATWEGTASEIGRQYAVRGFGTLRGSPLLACEAFVLDVGEQMVHPDAATVFSGLGWNVRYGKCVLMVAWGLWLAASFCGGWLIIRNGRRMDGWQRDALLGIALVVSVVVLSCGVSFGGGSRLRLPAELPLSMLSALAVTALFPSGGGGLQRLAGMSGEE